MKYKLHTPKRKLVSSASPTCCVSVPTDDAAATAGARDHVTNCSSKDSSLMHQAVRSIKCLFSVLLV